eukprot:jgi/Hompol1/5554/HPOL_004537-RA
MSSHLQSTRDATRDTLVKIAMLLGPVYLSFIVSELRTALKRGYQLHVLGYTLHAVLAALLPTVDYGSVDMCAQSIVDVCMQDIFGETGKERDVEELRGKMREIRITKSFDSLELLSRVISISKVGVILLPLKQLMIETSNIKAIRQIEEIFRRLANGMNANQGIDVQSFMTFVRGLVTENLALVQVAKQTADPKTNAERNFLIQNKRSDVIEPLQYYQANAHLFVEFGLSLLLNALRNNRLSLSKTADLQMLDPLVNVIGNSLYAKQVTVIVTAIRILVVIIAAPLPALVDGRPVVLKRLFSLIAKDGSTSSELVQSSFKLITVILRDCPDVVVTEKQIVTLATLVQPDLEISDHQNITFTLVRAILSRKYIVKEVYDLMDIIVRLIVTSQSSQIRALARQAYIQFLMGYPHGHHRFKKLMAYMIKNLEYPHESGRESILELLNMAVGKFSQGVLDDYGETLFIALVMDMVNDESAKCRSMSALVIKALVLKLEAGRVEKCIALVGKWFESQGEESIELRRTAAQVMGIFVQAFGDRSRTWVPMALQHFKTLLTDVVEEVEARMRQVDLYEGILGDDDHNGDDQTDSKTGAGNKHHLRQWELGYYSLNTMVYIVGVFPDVASSTSPLMASIWRLVSAFASKNRGLILRRSTFQFFAAITSLIPTSPPQVGDIYFETMIATLYRCIKDESFKGSVADELKRLAEEVLELIQKRLGTTAFIAIYNRVHRKVLEVRRQRKSEKSLLAVADPTEAAKQRIMRNEAKKAGRKRKAQHSAEARVRTKESTKKPKRAS